MTANNRPDPIKKSSLTALRSVIKGCADEACLIRKNEIRKSEKVEKYHAWNKKRQLGYFTRHNLLVYGFLTGLSYRDMEPGCDDLRIMDTGWVQQCIDVDILHSICKLHAPQLFASWSRTKLTKDDLKAWVREGKPFFLTREEFRAKNLAEKAKKKV